MAGRFQVGQRVAWLVNNSQRRHTMAKKIEQTADVQILEVEQGRIRFNIVGTSPLICNRMSAKSRGQLLMPSGRKTGAEKAANLKHDPLLEYRNSPYTLRDGPTLLAVLATAFKGAMRNAALDIPGAKKAQIGRLVYVEHDYIPISGVPQLLMSVTRSADINKTPDIRTRAILPKWAASIDVRFAKPILREQGIVNLLAAAGMFAGIGDWRPEKGAGNYGQFRLASNDDAEFIEIVKTGGRAAQTAAMNEPACYDTETEELLSWFNSEVQRRGFKVVA